MAYVCSEVCGVISSSGEHKVFYALEEIQKAHCHKFFVPESKLKDNIASFKVKKEFVDVLRDKKVVNKLCRCFHSVILLADHINKIRDRETGMACTHFNASGDANLKKRVALFKTKSKKFIEGNIKYDELSKSAEKDLNEIDSKIISIDKRFNKELNDVFVDITEKNITLAKMSSTRDKWKPLTPKNWFFDNEYNDFSADYTVEYSNKNFNPSHWKIKKGELRIRIKPYDEKLSVFLSHNNAFVLCLYLLKTDNFEDLCKKILTLAEKNKIKEIVYGAEWRSIEVGDRSTRYGKWSNNTPVETKYFKEIMQEVNMAMKTK
jgi:hypothetical protein